MFTLCKITHFQSSRNIGLRAAADSDSACELGPSTGRREWRSRHTIFRHWRTLEDSGALAVKARVSRRLEC